MNEAIAGLTIKAVSEQTGVSVHTLRAWERRYGVPQPSRAPGNRYRIYDEGDVADVLWMKRQIESGILPAQASKLLQQQRVSTSASLAMQQQPMIEIKSALQTALLQSDEAAARNILDQAFAMFMLEQVALQIIQPIMLEIGERWMRNKVTVWQEHFATNIIRQKLLAVFHSQPLPSPAASVMVSACAPGEDHELGLLILSLFARRRGWRVSYVGQATPLASLVDLAHASQPSAIAVSVSTVTGLAGLIPWLDSSQRPAARLVFGGCLYNSVPALREHVPGVFIGEDAVTAVNTLDAIQAPKQVWIPSKRAWRAAQSLHSARLTIAGETVNRFKSSKRPGRGTPDLNAATLFLIDALACALAFDAPELMDWHRVWIERALLPRGVTPQMIEEHRGVFGRALVRSLDAENARQFKTLLSRMEMD